MDMLLGVLLWVAILGGSMLTFSLPAIWFINSEKGRATRREEFNKRFGN